MFSYFSHLFYNCRSWLIGYRSNYFAQWSSMEAPAGSVLAPPFLSSSNGGLFTHGAMFGQHPHNTVITHGKENAVTYGVTTVAPGDILCSSGRRSIAVADSKRSSTSPTTESEGEQWEGGGWANWREKGIFPWGKCRMDHLDEMFPQLNNLSLFVSFYR